VSEADITRTEEALKRRALAASPAYKAAAQTDALKQATDRAARFAAERSTDLSAALDAYTHALRKQPAPAGPPPERYLALLARVPVPPLVVREFAAPRPAPAALPDADATDTVLWQPVIVLPADGKAALTFNLGAAPGGYRVLVAGHTADGRLGATSGVIPIVKPQTVTPGVPAGSVPRGVPVAPGPRQGP
jgi:hypothetical protein